jgi:ATP-dependent exoDNAse (exonuclease V) alpha subunit
LVSICFGNSIPDCKAGLTFNSTVLSDHDERGHCLAFQPNEGKSGCSVHLITVERENGERVSYDPRRLHGVTLYRETQRAFSEGDRVQFTAPDRERHVANRELGTIEKIEPNGNAQVRLDSGRAVAFNVRENPHLDHGYAVTSHSSQGQTADRVLIHVDTESAGEKLINRRLAYVAVSRGRYDAQIYTNDKTQLAEQLSRDVSHRTAVEVAREFGPTANHTERSPGGSQGQEHTQAASHGMSR